MTRTIYVVYTNTILPKEEYELLKNYVFLCTDDRIQIGDLIKSPMYTTPMQVVGVVLSTATKYNGIPIKTIKIGEILVSGNSSNNSFNNSPIKQDKMEKKSMFNNFIEKYKSQFIPEKDNSLKVTMNGNICVQVGEDWVSVDQDNNLVSYPEEMCMDVPVYTICKPFSQVKTGDIIKMKSSFVKVIKRNSNGTLQCLSFAGYSSNKKEIKDFILGQGFVNVVINMFSEMTTNGLNPMMLMLANNENMDMKDFMMFQMMQQGQGNTQFNPMMLMLLDKEGNSSMMETMLMMQMINGQNPMSNFLNNSTVDTNKRDK